MSDERQEGSPPSPGMAVRQLVRRTEEANMALARHLGLSVTDVAALDHLLSDGPLGPAQLADRLGMRSASATALVDRLEAAGHVARHRHPSDRRRLEVVPTEHAQREVLRALQPLLEGIEAAGAGLTADERATIVAYLDRVAETLDAYRASLDSGTR